MKKYTRFIALFLCLLFSLSFFSTVSAAEMTSGERATYVLTYDSNNTDYAGPELQYFSPYRVQYRLNNSSLKTMKTCIFSLYNTVDDTVIPVYCSDVNVLANSNYTYRRINLEDSSYAADAAGLIRAIVHNGFYLIPEKGETDEAHALRVEQELQRLGAAAGVEGLTVGEAITGTQAAIWQAAHGSSLVYNDYMYSAYKTDISDTVRYYDICDEERWNGHIVYTGTNGELFRVTKANDKELGDRIKKVCTYLTSLTPMDPNDAVVSSSSFFSLAGPFSYDNGDGTFDLKVTVTVDVRMEPGDTLTLSASLDDGNYMVSAPLSNGTQTVTLTIDNVPNSLANEKVLLEIAGLQSGFDVYLFDAEGEREASQSMVGMVDSRLPVYASLQKNITPGTPEEADGGNTEGTPDRILRFYKTTLIPNGMDHYDTFPLEGITFDIYFVATMSDYLSGKFVLPDAKEYDYPDTADFTLTTGDDGKASIDLTQMGMPDGVYLVVEREHMAIKAPVDPFFVIMPSTSPDGRELIYDVTIQPKNEIKGLVKIEKDVISLGNNSASVNAYSNHTWIISASIPDDIAEGRFYEIVDHLDYRLDYVGNIRVQVETADGGAVVTQLTEGTDYLLSGTGIDAPDDSTLSDTFTVSLTRSGMRKVAAAIGGDSFDNYRVRVYFDARINQNATLATEIPNEAFLYYTNSVNFDFSTKSDNPVVYTGGTSIQKIDALDPTITLSGAVFELYRAASEQEVLAGENLHTIPGFESPMIRVSFFDNKGLTGEKVTSVTSDESGMANLYGLAYGTYYLWEVQSPDDYNLPIEAVEITIDETSHTEERTIIVENVRRVVLPSTGAQGPGMYVLFGSVLLCSAAIFLFLRKMKAYSRS